MAGFTLHSWSHKSNWHSVLTGKWLFLLKWFVFQFPIISVSLPPVTSHMLFCTIILNWRSHLSLTIIHEIRSSFTLSSQQPSTPALTGTQSFFCLLIQWSRFLSSYKSPCLPWMLFQLCSVCASLAISLSLLEHGHENIYLLSYLPLHKTKLPLSPDPTQIPNSLSDKFPKELHLGPPLPTTC